MDDLIQAILEEHRSEKIALFEGGGGYNMRFKFAEADVVNKNSRKYPLAVLSKAVMEAQAKIEAGSSLLGACDHKPQMEISDVSHRLISVKMKDKDAIAEAAVLATVQGKNLTAIIAGGAAVGVSMRGVGSVKEGIVQEDYRLEGIDCVLSPSFDAHISAKNVYESEEFVPAHNAEDVSRRYEAAIRAGFRGSFKAFTELPKSGVDEEKVRALFQGALQAGYRGNFSDFQKSYLRRKT